MTLIVNINANFGSHAVKRGKPSFQHSEGPANLRVWSLYALRAFQSCSQGITTLVPRQLATWFRGRATLPLTQTQI